MNTQKRWDRAITLADTEQKTALQNAFEENMKLDHPCQCLECEHGDPCPGAVMLASEKALDIVGVTKEGKWPSPLEKLQETAEKSRQEGLCSWCEAKPGTHKVKKTPHGHKFNYLSCDECLPRFETVK